MQQRRRTWGRCERGIHRRLQFLQPERAGLPEPTGWQREHQRGRSAEPAILAELHRCRVPNAIDAHGRIGRRGFRGGLDDRFDHQITSDDLLDGEGLSYIGPTSTGLGGLEHSYQSFGNDGVSYNTNINNVYTGRSQSAAVLDALYYFSDHLPVVADYQVPAWMDVTVDPVPAEVNLGDSIDLDVLIENIADVVGVYGADELDYTLSVSGDLVGGATGTDAALGGGQTYQVSLETSSVGTKSGTITVSSSSQAVENSLFTFPISFDVVQPVDSADFDEDGDVDDIDLGYWDFGFAFGPGPQGFGDSDNDGDADISDLMIWQQQYTGPIALAAVPEPGLSALSLAGVLLLLRRR